MFDSASNPISFFSDLIMSLTELSRLTIVQEIDEHLPFNQKDEKICPALSKSSSQLATPTSNQIVEVDTRITLERWNQYQSKSVEITLTGRDYKRFCWIPEIVSQGSFRSLLIDGDIPITLPSLRGLLYSYHATFNSFNDSSFVQRLRTLVQKKAVASAIVNRWHEEIDSIVGTDAPSNLASRTSDEWLSPEQRLVDLELNTTTSFARSYAIQLARLAGKRFDSLNSSDSEKVLVNILSSQLLLQDRAVFKEVLGQIILGRKAAANEETQALLIDFLLKSEGIGDPRIHPENWAGIRDEAKQQVIQWLSREDINFFFELLLRDRDDKHGRKSFWLKYVDKISRSRALVSKEDLRHHAIRLREMAEKGRSYGELVGSNTSSAFVLDFGRIVVVEFSEVGNACYIYKKEAFTDLIENFWVKEIPFKLLKNQEIVAERITRSMKDWQSSARQVLSRFGVRRD